LNSNADDFALKKSGKHREPPLSKQEMKNALLKNKK